MLVYDQISYFISVFIFLVVSLRGGAQKNRNNNNILPKTQKNNWGNNKIWLETQETQWKT